MLELLKRAVLPKLSLCNAIERWHVIACKLAEPPRKRIPQTARIKDILC
jgi:hypothetical protein